MERMQPRVRIDSQGGLKLWIIILCVLSATPVVAGQPGNETIREINQLIVFVKTSQCRFYRNGAWHEASSAAEHILRKYDYVQKKGLINSTEDFIKYAATKSSMTGRKYKVQCGDKEAIDCADWLTAELHQIRH